MGQPLETHIRTLQERYWSEADPDGRAFVSLADALRKSGELVEAHRVLREGLGRHPEFPSGHVVAAWVARDRGLEEEAESEFRRVLELDPGNVAALRGLGELLRERGDLSEALEVMEALWWEDPSALDLPTAIQELRTMVSAPEISVSGPEDGIRLTVWDDPMRAEEEVDFSSAVLQADSTPVQDRSEPRVQEDSADEEPEAEAGSREDREETGVGIPEPRPGPHRTRVVEDGEPLPAREDLEDAILTPTLGEIYLRQGLFGRAAWVFESLLAEDPENQHLHQRLEEVRKLQTQEVGDGGEGPDEPPPASDTAPPVPAKGDLSEPVGARSRVPEDPDSGHSSPPLFVPADESGPMEVVSIDALAPDRRGSPAGLAGGSTVARRPSAEDRMGGDQEEETPEAPVSVEDLAPDAPVSIDALAPEAPVSIDDLAPEAPVSIDDLAPETPVSIDALAPEAPVSIDDLAPEAPVSIEGLAPDAPVPIDALAPDAPVPIDALAPDASVSAHDLAPGGILSIDDLAPDSRSPVDAPASGPPVPEPSVQDAQGAQEADPTLDDFERWLDKLQ